MAGTLDFAAQTMRGQRFSAVTAAFQTDGARTLGGRGLSIWDDFVDVPCNVIDGGSADPVRDGYHRSAEDAEFLADLGVGRYRFSNSWARIIGYGIPNTRPNPSGLDNYERVVDELLSAGVASEPTLYH